MAGAGGAWKVAYADFVTAMMAFFLVMWIVAQNKPVREAVADYFRNPSGRSDLPGKSGSGSGAKLPLKDGGPSPLDKSPFNSAKGRQTSTPGPQSDETTEKRTAAKGNRMVLGGDDSLGAGSQVPFPEDSAEVDEAGRRVLDRIAPVLQGKFTKIELRGHASGRMPADSSFKNPWDLSFARSLSTMKYLVDKGIEPRRIRLSQSGANDPNTQVNAVGEHVSNARVEILVLNEIVTTPSQADEIRNDRSKGVHPKKPAGRSKPLIKKSSDSNEAGDKNDTDESS